MLSALIFVFFFQAEDGIRDVAVTGVQTCALPICEAGGVFRARRVCARAPVSISADGVRSDAALLRALLSARAARARRHGRRLARRGGELPPGGLGGGAAEARRAADREGGTVERRGIPARAVLDDRARHLLADPRLRRARAGAARQVSAAAVSRRRRPGPLPAAPAGRLVGRTAAHSAAAAGARERRYRARRPRLATPAAGGLDRALTREPDHPVEEDPCGCSLS